MISVLPFTFQCRWRRRSTQYLLTQTWKKTF